ncbi:hypothetical protein ACFV9C_31810 [Kribbella sp. NPDC059898]|uniref:beta family protein n=1 Tax=Kribbella sp. NPDC059898 TaxID=3346995 RepID=UPI00364CEDF9
MTAAGDFQTLVVLRSRRGEFDALAALDLDHGVQPVLSLGYDPSASVDTMLEEVVRVARRMLGLGRLLMLDTANMAGTPGFDRPGAVLDRLADRLCQPDDLFDPDEVPFVPVVHTDADDRDLTGLGRLSRHLGHGCAVRVPMASATPGGVLAAIERIGTDPADVDLIVDLSYIAGADAFRVDEIAGLIDRLGEFRSRTILSGSVPRMLSRLHRWEQQRFEEDVWRSLVAGGVEGLRLGDYGIAHPVWDPRGFPTKHVNVKYTCGDHWLYLRERMVAASDESSTTRTVRLVSRYLVESNSFFGAGYSWGDHRFAEAADGLQQGLSRTKVVSFATSHHLAYLADLAA